LVLIVGIAFAVAANVSFAGAQETESGLVAHWVFDPTRVTGRTATDVLGRQTGRLVGEAKVLEGEAVAALVLDGLRDCLVVTDDTAIDATGLPNKNITVLAWVVVETPTRWGGIVGAVQDNGDSEQGWVLGYDESKFTWALAGKGADDGDGKLTYLTADTEYKLGRWFHVAGTYDGREMKIYVNGQLAGVSNEQSGEILYPPSARHVIGAYWDTNEFHPLHGAIREVRVYDRALTPDEVAADFSRNVALVDAPPVRDALKLIVGPYLQGAALDGMTIMWETNRSGTSVVEYGPANPPTNRVEVADAARIHEVRLKDLESQTQYFYRVQTVTKEGDTVSSDVYTFQTAVRPETAFAFAVISDTQTNPPVLGKIAELVWGQRPNFIVHCGDIVGTGSEKRQWVMDFFLPTTALLQRVPIFPTLGNHEQNTHWYYDYFALPAPEYHYDYEYGNAHFFVIDTNKDVSPGSEQYNRLDRRLGASTAKWKFAYHHHPAYTSDSNDYGDTYKGGSTFGDVKVQDGLVPLYEKHGVDIVFQGHVHSYERTWPIRDENVDQERGVVYVTAAGSGGGLENFAPSRTWFAARLLRGHHYCYVTIHDGTLRFQAYDLEGRLFDTLEIRK
jgi:predicted phosphodiesterase